MTTNKIYNCQYSQLRDKMEKYSSVIEEGRIIRFKALERTKFQDKEFRQKEAQVIRLIEGLRSLTKKQAIKIFLLYKIAVHHRNHIIKAEIEKNIPALTYLNSEHEEAPLGRKY